MGIGGSPVGRIDELLIKPTMNIALVVVAVLLLAIGGVDGFDKVHPRITGYEVVYYESIK